MFAISCKKIHVLIAEDMEPIRKRYEKILSGTDFLEVVAAVGSGADAIEQSRLTHPDVILMDIEMEKRDSGLYAAKVLLEEDRDLKIIILTVYEEDELIFTAFQLGVCDYIFKNASPDEIIKSIRNAYEGKSPLRAELATRILDEFKRIKSYESNFLFAVNIVSTLTKTELEVLTLLLQNKTRREICKLRFVEMSTVKTQIHNILRKFNKKTIEEVASMIESMNLYDFICRQSKL